MTPERLEVIKQFRPTGFEPELIAEIERLRSAIESAKCPIAYPDVEMNNGEFFSVRDHNARIDAVLKGQP